MRINEFVPDTKVFDVFNKQNQIKNKDLNKEEGFSSILKNQLDKVNDKQIKSEQTTQAFIKGDEEDIHNVMLNSEEAKLSMEMAVQVRNKLVEAYQELSRMQL